MSALVPWQGQQQLTASQEFLRLALALERTYRSTTVNTGTTAEPINEPVIQTSRAFYFGQSQNPDRIIVLAQVPLVPNWSELGGKDWLKADNFGSASIPASFGLP